MNISQPLLTLVPLALLTAMVYYTETTGDMRKPIDDDSSGPT